MSSFLKRGGGVYSKIKYYCDEHVSGEKMVVSVTRDDREIKNRTRLRPFLSLKHVKTEF